MLKVNNSLVSLDLSGNVMLQRTLSVHVLVGSRHIVSTVCLPVYIHVLAFQ